MDNLIRLNKYICDAGVCSRREADSMIESGRVRVNGKKSTVGAKINPAKDKIVVDGKLVENRNEDIYIAFNKPEGITCTTDKHERNNIVEYVNYTERVFNIGRLDKDSEGLIFLTNNGDIVNKILRAGNNHEKEYLVTVNKKVTDEFIRQMGSGVPILGTMTKKCLVRKDSEYTFYITLTQGLNRQIRRMCEALGYAVLKLQRIRVMNISLKGIPLGHWRLFTESEVAEMMDMIKDSDNSEAASKGLGAKTEEKIFGWQAELKLKKELKLAEAAKNPKSRTLRSGRKQSQKNMNSKSELLSGKKTGDKKTAPVKSKRTVTKDTNLRMEDAIKDKNIIAAAREKMKDKRNDSRKSAKSRSKSSSTPSPRRGAPKKR